MKNLNKSFLKKLLKKSNEELLILGQAFKIENMVNSTNGFQRNYNTILAELKRRKLLR